MSWIGTYQATIDLVNGKCQHTGSEPATAGAHNWLAEVQASRLKNLLQFLLWLVNTILKDCWEWNILGTCAYSSSAIHMPLQLSSLAVNQSNAFQATTVYSQDSMNPTRYTGMSNV